MKVELLVVPNCPHEALTRDMIETLLLKHRLAAPVTTIMVSTDEDAQVRGFTGSPTILIDGEDPFREDGALVGLACRVYRTPTGLSGMPDEDTLAGALATAFARGQKP